MWGESSKNCENNCQCSGLITENFKINSGNNATKRKQESAINNNYKLKMNPHSLDFTSPNNSPKATPSKRRILGEIQNIKTSPLIDRLKSPIDTPSKLTPLNLNMLNVKSPMVISPLTTLTKSPNNTLPFNPLTARSPMAISPLTSLASPLMNSPIIATCSPLTSRLKRCSKITKIFEERTRFKMENKENENFSNYTESYEQESYKAESYKQESFKAEIYKQESYLKFDLEETARDFSFGERFQASRERENWASTKLDFTDALPAARPAPQDLVPDPAQDLEDLESLQDLHDLEAAFESDSFEQCTKYEIISTDSPNVISRGRSTSRKICSRNFEFGAPLSDTEPSTSFNRPATRMLNFDDDNFEFTSPAVKKTVTVKKSLKFSETSSKFGETSDKFGETATKFGETSVKFGETSAKFGETSVKFGETPTKNPLRHERSDSSIGSMSSLSSSPSKLSRIFTSDSTASMESGFISELDEQFLEIDESNSPKIANFNDLLSGQINDNIIMDRGFLKRPSLARSLSFHPESKARVSLLSVLESPSEEKRKRDEGETASTFEQTSKRRRSNCENPSERIQRPALQRAFSENNASIKSALARSSVNSDLIGDYSCNYALPLTHGDHEDLKSISCDTLAALLRGEYQGTVPEYQVIDCRYPYEFDGGHIDSAVNLYTPEQVQALVSSPPLSKTVLIFHCEFSIERGPKLSRTLRSFDRSHNRAQYPSLAFPELYLLHGGYRAFHRAHAALCRPAGYTPMLDPQHKHLLRRHRSLQGRNRLLL